MAASFLSLMPLCGSGFLGVVAFLGVCGVSLFFFVGGGGGAGSGVS